MPTLRVKVEYDGVSADFTGRSADEVVNAVNNFLVKLIPELELAKRLHLDYTLRDLAELFGDYIKITPEGPSVIVDNARLSDKQTIALQLIAAKVAYQLGELGNDYMTLQDIEKSTAMNPKSISSRLSELVKLGYVEKKSKGGSVGYRITTKGVNWLSRTLKRRG